MKITKVVAGIGVVLLVLIGFNQYTKHAENQRLAAQKASEEAKVNAVLAQAKGAFAEGRYAEARQLIEPYRTRGDAGITQLVANIDKADVLAYQLEQSDFYKKNPPVETRAWELKTGGMNYNYSFTDADSSREKVGVEFNHDRTGNKRVAVVWNGPDASTPAKLTVERERFITGLVKAIFPQLDASKLAAYIRANQSKAAPNGWDSLPRADIDGVRVFVGSDGPTLMVGFGGGTTEELSKIAEPSPDAVECSVLIKQWLAAGSGTSEIAEILPKAKSSGRCFDKPVDTSVLAEADPRNLLKVGAHLKSDELASLIDKHYPGAKYAPNQTIQVAFSGKQYLVLTQKLMGGSGASYEIVAVVDQ